MLSLEAFNCLDHFYNRLVPEIDLAGEELGGSFVWVCTYAGMKFFRPLTMAEMFDQVSNRGTTLN